MDNDAKNEQPEPGVVGPVLDVHAGSSGQGARTTTAEAVSMLAELTEAAARVQTGLVTGLFPALQGMARSFQKLSWTSYTRPTDCTCPTPTHRMSCGHGARPVVCR